MQTLADIINSIHSTTGTTEKGSMFELLCLYFLKYDEVYSSAFSDVWLWKNWPGNNGQHDTGIDIVAKLRNSESFCAVQCKFRDDDSSITKPEIDSFLASSSKTLYSRRILFTLTANLGQNALSALDGQVPKVELLTLHDLDSSTLDWSGYPERVSFTAKQLRPHQKAAVTDVLEGFSHHDRGRLIMACGTGKTFTSQKIAENLAGKGKHVLVLVPSISLLNQTLLAWSYDHDENIPIKSYVVCSDKTVGKYPDEDMTLADLAVPPTTESEDLLRDYSPDDNAMTVIFSTYQSIDVVHDAQSKGFPEFDIVICDEAHRTAGLALKDKKDSVFRKIHDAGYIHSRKRLYMTATPKVYGDTPDKKADLHKKAADNQAVLYDMDDEEIFGPVFHRLTFSQAVKDELLSDYKVMVFMIDTKDKDDPSLPTIIEGVRKALAKDISPIDGDFLGDDTSPMRRAVAFSSTINNSENFAKHFNDNADSDDSLHYETKHIDGSTPASQRSSSLQWLKDSHDSNTCRILSNARCLCEGVDVPALDAVIFISPKTSEIDIVQSVGRVMRKAQGKSCGYVILPVIVRPGETPEYALDHNESYKTVWKVLQALRAHDDHFDIEINSLDFAGSSTQIRVTGGGKREDWFTDELFLEYKHEIDIRMVRKCGEREYLTSLTGNFVNAFHDISARLTSALARPEISAVLEAFTESLRQILNPSIRQQDTIEMLAQHITSKEVFDSVFAGFSANNTIYRDMQHLRSQLESQGLNLEPSGLDNFNEYVRRRAESASEDEKQNLVKDIYGAFFRTKDKDEAKTHGIVYTDNAIVDFIIKSADWAVRELIGIPEGLSADGVHILDPFSGTGTFTARLLQLGIIPEAELKQKYKTEIHANEILLLAYYISAANIEAVYNHAAQGSYKEFAGMVLTDTFRLNTDFTTPPLRRNMDDIPPFYEDSRRAYMQESGDIHVIIGNPPYSVGRKSKKGDIYEKIDANITESYAEHSTATNKKSLYDSYIRAFRWASDRIEQSGGKGVICYVSNGSFIDSNSADGMRKCLAEEFTHIYVFNLRGNAMTSGELRRKERGNVFGEGTRCPIAITLLVRDGVGRVGKGSPCEIGYYEVGDYLTRKEKLAELVRRESFGAMESAGAMREIVPNLAGDWVNQRGEEFGGFMNLGNKNEPGRDAIFGSRYSRGVNTGRDTWCYNFSREALCENIRTLNPEALTEESVRVGLYRPYVKMMMHFSRETNERVYQMPQLFPKSDTKNMVIYITGIGANKDFSALMTDCIPNSHFLDTGQCFPLFWYEEVNSTLFGSYTARRDGISDETLTLYRLRCHDGSITKEDIFCWIYGVLSSREYAERFGKDTKRLLARVPAVKELARFRAFRDAGRELGRLHVGYEDVKGYALREEWTGTERDYTVKKMKVAERRGERVIRYSERLTIGGIPAEAWEYVVNGRSALEWVVERYSDSVDGKSGLRNDGNAWGRERGNERYIVDLIGKVVSVSVETVRILRGMPELGV